MTLMWDVHREKDMQVPDIAFTTGDQGGMSDCS